MTEKTDIEKAIDWMENSTHANAYGDTRNAEKMVDYILSCLEKCKREEVDDGGLVQVPVELLEELQNLDYPYEEERRQITKLLNTHPKSDEEA